MNCYNCKEQFDNNEISIETLELNCKNCLLGTYDRSIVNIYYMYCNLFNKLIPFETSLEIFFNDFYELEISEARFYASCFLSIYSTILEQQKIKEQMRKKAQERKNKLKGRNRRK